MNGGDLPEFTVFLNFLSPVLGPLVGWLFIGAPLQRNAEERRLVQLTAVLERVGNLVVEHRPALSRNLSIALKHDDYGTIKQDTRHCVWRNFLVSCGIDSERFPEAFSHASRVLGNLEAAELEGGFDVNALPINGHDFERWVARGLGRHGWKVKVTIGSGDQGIDVIAERNGRRLGIQCKLYSGNISNKAVQEAHAGKVHYRLDDAAVLTNSKFTPSAQILAKSTGTYLLSHFDIPALHKKLQGYD